MFNNKLSMKNSLYLVLFSLVFLFVSCEQETMTRDLTDADQFERIYTPTPVTSLNSWAGYDLLVLSSGSEIFSWKPSALRKGSKMLVRYEALFGVENETYIGKSDVALLSVKTADEEGVDTLLTLSHSNIDKIASAAGIGADQIGTLSWKVRAYCGMDSSLSTATGYFKVLRPAATAGIKSLNLNVPLPYYIDKENKVHYITIK